ncbi:MAG: OmpA family protein [Methylococcales bacterium]
MNKKTLNKHVSSKLSNNDPQPTDFSPDKHYTTESDEIQTGHKGIDSVSDAIKDPENNNDATKASNEIAAIGAVAVAAAKSAFSMFKSILNKSVVAVKETTTNLDETDSAKKALEKGTDAVKDVVTNLSVPDSVTGAAKNIFDKSMDTIKHTKAVIGSEDSLADKAKNIVRWNNNDQHDTSSKIRDATAQANDQFTGKTVETDRVDTISAAENDNARTITDMSEEAVSELIGNNDHSTTTVADKIEVSAVETHVEHTNENINTAEDHSSMVNHAQLTDTIDETFNEVAETISKVLKSNTDNSPNTVDIDHSPAWKDNNNNRVEIETVAVETVVTEGMSARSTAEDETLNHMTNAVAEGANEVRTSPAADIDATDTVSASKQAFIDTKTSTVRAVIAAESKIQDTSADDSLDTNHGAIKDIDTTSPGSGSYANELPAETASTETSGFRWVVPLVLLALVGAATWWLTSFQSKQPTDELTASAHETVSTDQSQNSVVTPNTDFDGSPENGYSTTPGATGVASDIKSVDDLSVSTASKLSTKINSVSTGIDTYGNKTDNSSNTTLSDNNAVKTGKLTQVETVTDKNNIANMMKTLPAGGPVDAIASFLKSSDTTAISKGFILHGLNFELDSSDISGNSTQIITDLAAVLKAYPNIKIRLEGHTDSRGEADANMALSASRANAVKIRLVSLSIDPARINTIGMGETYPITADKTQAWESKNRRVEVIITDQ